MIRTDESILAGPREARSEDASSPGGRLVPLADSPSASANRPASSPPCTPTSALSWVQVGIVAACLGLAGAGYLGLQGARESQRLRTSASAFDAGVERIRACSARMEALVLRFQLDGDQGARLEFEHEARATTGRLTREVGASRLGSPEEAAAGDAAWRAWETYVAALATSLERTGRALRRDAAEAAARRVGDAATSWQTALGAWQAARVAGRPSGGGLSSGPWIWPLVMGLAMASVALGTGCAWGGHVHRLRLAHQALAAGAARREELVSLGTFMAGVAHELRNPLAAIKVRLFELRRQQAHGAGLETVEIISGELRRLEHMLDEVLAYARPAPPRLAAVDVGALLGGVAELVRGAYERRGIAISVEPGEGLSVHADAEQIRQVLLNLVRNGVECLDGTPAGRVIMRATAGLDARRDGADRQVVLIEVADNGPGIPEAVRERLFEPFFSTKPAGTGLGLPMARRIAEAHLGELRYRTRPGAGTTFTLVLPRTSHDEAKAAVGGG